MDDSDVSTAWTGLRRILESCLEVTGVSEDSLLNFTGSFISLLAKAVLRNLLATSILGGLYKGVLFIYLVHTPPTSFLSDLCFWEASEMLTGALGVKGVSGESWTGISFDSTSTDFSGVIEPDVDASLMIHDLTSNKLSKYLFDWSLIDRENGRPGAQREQETGDGLTDSYISTG